MNTNHLVLVLACLALSAAPARACCGVQRPEGQIHLADQEILVVWDAEHKRETFVRRAAFRTGGAADFGFLVPTPTAPKLSEAHDALFMLLDREIRPVPVPVKVYEPAFTPLVAYPFIFTERDDSAMSRSTTKSKGHRGAPAGPPPVRILQEVKVAGYDATVLEADSAQALNDWLGKHKYAATPEVKAWIEPYVAHKWKITAFRYERHPGSRADALSTGCISMAFDTDRPLFPYRVPTSQLAAPGDPSILRVFYVGPGRAEGRLGDAAKPWNAKVKFASQLETFSDRLHGMEPNIDFDPTAWLTAFEDRPWPSGTEDLYFRPAADAAAFHETFNYEVKTVVPLPLDLMLFLGYWVWRRFRRKGAGKA